jgi:hypothetical protein
MAAFYRKTQELLEGPRSLKAIELRPEIAWLRSVILWRYVMRQACISLFFLLAGTLASGGQTQPPPQTARQALIEMFLGKGDDAFEKHLPEVAHRALIRKGDSPANSTVQRIAMIGRQITQQGFHVETFDEGSMLLVSEQNDRRERVEVMVEHDSFMGEEEELEVSVHNYRNGEPEFLPVVPRLIFSMKQEKEVWRLNEVTVALHAPLTDPDYLKGLRKEQDEANESMASGRVGMIASAEARYAAAHPEHGYTCNLAELFGKEEPSEGGSDAADQAPAAYDLSLAGNEFAGYRLALSGCNGSPASKYQITAAPIESDSEMKIFCADQSGYLRFTIGGKPSACFSQGQAVNPRGNDAGMVME